MRKDGGMVHMSLQTTVKEEETFIQGVIVQGPKSSPKQFLSVIKGNKEKPREIFVLPYGKKRTLFCETKTAIQSAPTTSMVAFRERLERSLKGPLASERRKLLR